MVALTHDLPQHGLRRGQVGTVVEVLASGVFAVEFNDDAGRTYALASVEEAHLLVLHFLPAATPTA